MSLSVAPYIEWTSADGVVTSLRVLAGARGLGMASYELFTQSSSAVDGDRITGVRATPREIMLPILLEAATREDLVEQLNRLARSMRPKRGDGTLTVTAPDGSQRSIQARYVEGLEGRESTDTAFVTWWKVGLLFHASQPYWTGPARRRSWDVGEAVPSFFPFGPDWHVRSSQIIGLDMTIGNPGDVESYPIWTIHGPVASGTTLRSDTLGKEWTLNRELLAGDVAVVDCRQRVQTAVLNGSVNLWPDLSDGAVLWPLAPGDNSIDMMISGASDATLIELAFTPRFEIAYSYG